MALCHLDRVGEVIAFSDELLANRQKYLFFSEAVFKKIFIYNTV